MFKKLSQKAFSLIELMVVIGIVAIISAVSIGSLSVIQENSKDTQRQADLQVLKGALQQFYADQNFYPNSLILTGGATLDNCTGTTSGCSVTKTYLGTTPKDPVPGTSTPYCYSAQYSVTDTTTCNGSNLGKCHFYNLCATMENPTAPVACTCPNGGGGSGNTKVSPL